MVYLGIGLVELFDDFWQKPKPWMRMSEHPNGYLMLTHKIGHKMHAGLCVILGLVALNGALEGHVTRFELELIFISFAVIMLVLWATYLPGRLGSIVIATKPEFWLQIVMFAFFFHLVRPEILAICIGLNLGGLFVYIFQTRRIMFRPYTYEQLRRDTVEAKGEETAARFDKLAGYTGEPAADASKKL